MTSPDAAAQAGTAGSTGDLPDRTLRYDDRVDAVIDLHEPAGEPVGTIVVVHGGFWKAAWDRTHTRRQARALTESGFLVATPEYRRVPEATWPTPGEDLLAALETMDALAARSSYPRGPRVLLGHSAGGQLALWLGTRLALDRAPAHQVRPDQIVALAPVCDLDEAVRLRLGDDAVHAMLGDAPIDSADPMRLIRPGIQTSVVHGIEDDIVPIELSRNLARAHPWVDLAEVPGGHFEPITPGTTAWAAVLDRIVRDQGDEVSGAGVDVEGG